MILAASPTAGAPRRDNFAMSEHTPFDALPTSGAAPLAHWQVVRASGADAVSFLQGQLTHDLALLAPEAARLNAYCNPQGRMLANFVSWRDGEQDVCLAMPTDLAEPTLKRLRMFVMRAQCQLTETVDQAQLFGVWGAAVPTGLTQPWALLREAGRTWVRLNDGAHGLPRALCWGATAPDASNFDEATWDAVSIGAAEAWLTPETVAAFVPQMLNWESLDGISFKKGCYPGQEVVARSQFRGAIKRRTERVSSSAPLSAGQAVFAAGQEVGTVVNAAPLGAGHVGLVCVHVAEAADQTLHAGTADGAALQRLGLPYALRDDI